MAKYCILGNWIRLSYPVIQLLSRQSDLSWDTLLFVLLMVVLSYSFYRCILCRVWMVKCWRIIYVVYIFLFRNKLLETFSRTSEFVPDAACSVEGSNGALDQPKGPIICAEGTSAYILLVVHAHNKVFAKNCEFVVLDIPFLWGFLSSPPPSLEPHRIHLPTFPCSRPTTSTYVTP